MIKKLHNCEYYLPHGEYGHEDTYGPAIDRCIEYGLSDKELWVTNGEYSSQVNYCPFCGYEAKVKIKSH